MVIAFIPLIAIAGLALSLYRTFGQKKGKRN